MSKTNIDPKSVTAAIIASKKQDDAQDQAQAFPRVPAPESGPLRVADIEEDDGPDESTFRPELKVGQSVILSKADALKDPSVWFGSAEVGVIRFIGDDYFVLEDFEDSPKIHYFDDWPFTWVLQEA